MIFCRECLCKNPFVIVFLCGSKYNANDPREKRKILQKYLEENDSRCRAIILEENFVFSKTNNRYLSYDDIFMNGLAQIEQMAAIYADRVIIIHETFATAAELGAFAINPRIADKICLLVPDDNSIEENKLSAFIRLAFLNKKNTATRIKESITYYPDVEVYRKSMNKSEYHTYFHNNRIGNNLGLRLNNLLSVDETVSICIKRSRFGKVSAAPYQIDYYINDTDHLLEIEVDGRALRMQLLSMLRDHQLRAELRKRKPIKDHVNCLQKHYERIMLDSICEYEGLQSNKFKVSIEIKEVLSDLRQSVGYFIYMLQAARLIRLVKDGNDGVANVRKIVITNELDKIVQELSALLCEKRVTAFERS